MKPSTVGVHEFERANAWTITVGVPTLGMISMRWHVCMLGLKAPMNTPLNYQHVIGLEVGQARNVIVAEALAFHDPAKGVRCSHVFFVDDDCLLSQSALQQLVARNRPMVSGLYYSKSTPPYPLILPAKHGGTLAEFQHGDLVDCFAHGMGCTLIHLDVFRSMVDAGVVERSEQTCTCCQGVGCRGCFNGGRLMRFFSTTKDARTDGPRGPEVSSQTEDVYFCERAALAGVQPCVDTGVFAFHYDSAPQSETCGECYPLPQWREYRASGRIAWPEAVPA